MTEVAEERIARQLRNFLDPVVRSYYRTVVGDRFAFERLPDDARVLDVGAGAGRYGYLLADRCERYVGVDLSTTASAVGSVVTSAPNADFAAADGTALPFSDDSFDAILAVGTFNAIEDLDPFLTEFRRVLVDGGLVIFNCNNWRTVVPHKRNPGFAHHTTEDIHDSLQAAGFRSRSTAIGFFVSRRQKKLLLSERMPVAVRLLGLSAVRLQNGVLSRLPGVGRRGAHIWVAATADPP